MCGGRRGSIDLRVPGGDDPQHRGIRARLSECDHDLAGTELSIDPEHPECGQRRHLSQLLSTGETPVDRWRFGRADRRIRGWWWTWWGLVRHRGNRSTCGRCRIPPRWRGRLLSNQCSVEVGWGDLHSDGDALQGSWWGALLWAAWGAGCARVSAVDSEPGGRGIPATDPQRSQARYRRSRRGRRRAVGRARANNVRRSPPSGTRSPRPGHTLAQCDHRVRRDDGCVANSERLRCRCADGSSGGPRANRVRRRTAAIGRSARWNENREPRGTRIRRPGVRGREWGIHPGGIPRTDRARCRFGSDSRRQRARRRRHPDDPAHGQRLGVPGGFPHGNGGRNLSAHSVPRGSRRVGRGASARLRRAHSGPAAPLPDARGESIGVGNAGVQPGLTVPWWDPRGLDGVEARRAGGPADRLRGLRGGTVVE